MKTIALVNDKGGVGKTTLTANLAAGLALMVKEEYPVYRTMLRENKTLFADAPQYGVPVVMRKAYGDTYRQIQEDLMHIVDELCACCRI